MVATGGSFVMELGGVSDRLALLEAGEALEDGLAAVAQGLL